MRYLMIMEDGSMFKSEGITASDIEGVKAGVVDIVDTEKMAVFYGETWRNLEEWLLGKES